MSLEKTLERNNELLEKLCGLLESVGVGPVPIAVEVEETPPKKKKKVGKKKAAAKKAEPEPTPDPEEEAEAAAAAAEAPTVDDVRKALQALAASADDLMTGREAAKYILSSIGKVRVLSNLDESLYGAVIAAAQKELSNDD